MAIAWGCTRFTTALRFSSLYLTRPKLRRPTAGIGCASAFHFLTRVLERLLGIPSPSLALRKRYAPWQAAKLLYIGISPNKLSKPPSTQSLRSRIQYHYRGNAEGSTLRRTLGILLAEESGYPLRRVGSGKRMTLTQDGERWLNRWLELTRSSRDWRTRSLGYWRKVVGRDVLPS